MNNIIQAISDAKKTRDIYMQWARDLKKGNVCKGVKNGRREIAYSVASARYWSARLIKAKRQYAKAQLLLF